MTTSNDKKQPGPVAQQLTKLQSNERQMTISQLKENTLPGKKRRWGVSDKTVWDWLQLLIVPFLLAVGGFWFSAQQNQISLQMSDRQHQTDIQIAKDQQQEATLQTYLDRMSELLLNGNLSKSKPGDEVRNVARVQTLTTLSRLVPTRKGIILLFLYEAGLITGSQRVIDLNGADLSGITLSQLRIETPLPFPNLNTEPVTVVNAYATAVADTASAGLTTIDLSGINLSGANLYEANLSGVTLYKADLTLTGLFGVNLTLTNLIDANLDRTDLRKSTLKGAYLVQANLLNAQVTQAQLAETSSLQGATMPDGSIHP